MYISKSFSKTSNDTFLYLVEGYRGTDGKVKKRIIKSYGSLKKLLEQDINILEKLKLEAKQLTKEKKNGQMDLTIFLDLTLELSNSVDDIDKNYGYFFLENIYNELGLSTFIKNISANYNFKYNLDQILKLLTFSRILSPTSKLETINQQDRYFESFDVSLEDTYRSLDILNEIKEDIQYHLHQEITNQYKRDCSLVFYDVTNYYFETDDEDELRKVGFSKENKKSPIVSMGLFIDNNGIPIGYKLFPGNTHDSQTLIPILKEFKQKFNLGKIIVTADKGLNSKKNLIFLANSNDGYIVSQKIRGSSKGFIKKVLDEEGFLYNKANTFKIKKFTRERKIDDTVLTENVIVFWSKEYDDREKYKRKDLLNKIENFINKPSKYKASNRFGAKKYLKEIQVNHETGEITKEKTTLIFEQEKYERDVSLDGYYVIITNQLDLSAQEVINKYRGLWKIEESFRVIKSDLRGRPVYVRNESRIEGHFLICYLALTITRILEHKLKHKHSIKKIQAALNSATCISLEKGIYRFKLQTDTFKEIEKLYNVNMINKYNTLENIRTYRKQIKLATKK